MRPGAITAEEIEGVLRRKVRSGGDPNNNEAPIAPGMKYTHYSPKQPVYIMNGEKQDWLHFIEKLRLKNQSFGILASDEMIEMLQEIAIKQKEWIFSLGKKETPQQASQRFYSGLRYFDDKDIDYILVEAYPKKGIGEAFMNRLEKASSGSYPTGLTTPL
ncbi:Sua5 family C-terminal domain-containing protein [Jeotgalibaca sp. MA1X17-3]|uniref:Sua5 family C-terminal domain-containing protein n=1 Tax=Jeotgalibaca sp. MA1X17-3 TaxID=2908211 RepID=UPI0037C068B2